MMKHRNIKFIVILMLVGVCSARTTFAQSSGLGLGVIFGENTGISLKNWGGGTTAIVGGIAWTFGDRDALHLHLDYLLHDFGLFQVASGRLPIYYGIGARAKFVEGKGKHSNNNKVGVRIPLGIDYLFAQPSLDVFFELVPVFDFAPETEFDLSGGIGIRYFFD